MPVNIHGKEYVMVHERVAQFRKEHPDWCIVTDMVRLDGGMAVFKCSIYKDDSPEFGNQLSTGYAYEREDSTQINKTSFIENCETSAVGRALAFLGYGIDASIASADEVAQAITQQGKPLETQSVAGLKREVQTAIAQLGWDRKRAGEHRKAIVGDKPINDMIAEDYQEWVLALQREVDGKAGTDSRCNRCGTYAQLSEYQGEWLCLDCYTEVSKGEGL